MFLLREEVRLYLQGLLRAGGALPSLVILPLGVRSTIKGVLLELPAKSAEVLPPCPEESSNVFSKFLVFGVGPDKGTQGIDVVEAIGGDVSIKVELMVPCTKGTTPDTTPYVIQALLPNSTANWGDPRVYMVATLECTTILVVSVFAKPVVPVVFVIGRGPPRSLKLAGLLDP